MRTLINRQQGTSFIGMLLIAICVILVAVLGMRVVPPYIHSAQIARVFKEITNDPAMQDAAVKDIRASYIKRADINYITDIKAEDLEILKGNGQLSISASYTVEIPLVGNATLLLEFNPSSS